MALIPLDELQCSSGVRATEENPREVNGSSPFTAISYDAERDILIFDGVCFSGEFMRQFANPSPGWFSIEKREDGVVIVHWKPE